MRADTGGAIRNLERDAALAREELKAADRYKIDDPDVFSRQEIIRSRARSHARDAAHRDLRFGARDPPGRREGRPRPPRHRAAQGGDRHRPRVEGARGAGDQGAARRHPRLQARLARRDHEGRRHASGRASRWARSRSSRRCRRASTSSRPDAGGLAAGGCAPPWSSKRTRRSSTRRRSRRSTRSRSGARAGFRCSTSARRSSFSATDAAVMKPGQRVRAVLALDARADGDQRSAERHLRERREEDRLQADRARSSSPPSVTLGPGGGRPGRRGERARRRRRDRPRATRPRRRRGRPAARARRRLPAALSGGPMTFARVVRERARQPRGPQAPVGADDARDDLRRRGGDRDAVDRRRARRGRRSR